MTSVPTNKTKKPQKMNRCIRPEGSLAAPTGLREHLPEEVGGPLRHFPCLEGPIRHPMRPTHDAPQQPDRQHTQGHNR